MSVTIGFQIGSKIAVTITEEINGNEISTAMDPREFLRNTGLDLYFFQLKPEMARMLKAQDARKRRGKRSKPKGGK